MPAGKGSASSSQLGHVVFRNIEPEVSTSLSRTFEHCDGILQYCNTSMWSAILQREARALHCGASKGHIVGTKVTLWGRTQPLGRLVADNGELENRRKQFL